MRLVTHRSIVLIAAVGVMSAVPAVAAQPDGSMNSTSSDSHSRDVQSAQDRVNDAVGLVQQMKQDPALAAVLQQAKGVFIRRARSCSAGRSKSALRQAHAACAARDGTRRV